MKKYIVAWAVYDNREVKIFDHYNIFIDNDSDSNYKLAKDFYEHLLTTDVYSANICEIIESTDYL